MPRHKPRHKSGPPRRPSIVELLDQLYSRLPEVHCKGLCTEACGPIGMQEWELKRIANRTGQEPTASEDGVCSLLTEEGRCSVYTIRPLVCRLFGAVRRMKCPHGCVPDRWITDEESAQIMKEAMRIAGPPVLVHIEGLSLPDGLERIP